MSVDRLDARLDALALVRALLNDDRLGFDAVISASDDPDRLRAVLISAIAGWACLLKEVYGRSADQTVEGVRKQFEKARQ